MASFSKSSTSYDISSSSQSENEIGSSFQFDSIKINSNKTSKTSLPSNLSTHIANNSLRYFKNLKKKKSKSSTQFKNKHSTSMYQPKSLETTRKNQLTVLKNKKTKNFKNKNTSYANLIDLNQKFAEAFESSSDSDFPDIKYLKIISKNKEMDTSTISKESKESISSLSSSNKGQLTINSPKNNNNNKNRHLESSTSSNSFEFSHLDTDTVHVSNKDGYNKKLDLDELLSDCSLSDVLFIRDDRGGSKFSPTLETNNVFLRMKSKSPETLPLNISFEMNNIPQSPLTLSNIAINIPDLTSDDNENEPNHFPEDIEMDEPENIPNNKHFKGKEIKSTINNHNIVNTYSGKYPHQFVDSTEMNEKVHTLNNECPEMNETASSLEGTKSTKSDSIPNRLQPTEINNGSKRKCDHCNHSIRSRNENNISQDISGADKRNRKKSKSREKTMENTSDFLRIKRSSITKKTKKNRTLNTSNKTEDIGLEYDTDKDNFMVEFPNGALVPAFLSTLKSRKLRKLCACGITPSEIPPIWSESFHDVLHLNLYKLRFTGDLTDIEAINFKENDLCYKILILRGNQYNDERIKTSIKNVDDFVSLEYGISKTGIQSHNHFTYLAVLPNFKVIGLLQAEPIQEAHTLTADEQLLGNTVPVKFGVSKIWTFIKYRNKNIDFNLMETFREKENLEKIEDLAFFPDGCQGIQFIQDYTGNKDILIYTYNDSSPGVIN